MKLALLLSACLFLPVYWLAPAVDAALQTLLPTSD